MQSIESMTTQRNTLYSWYVVGVLIFAYIVSFVDRLLLGLLVQPLKASFNISDTEVGLLAGVGFALFYSVMGIPLGRLADTGNRKWLVIIGASLWSLMTALTAFADSFLELLLLRIGVGVGEAALTPAAVSIIADYFTRDRVSKALGAYSIGVYVGAGMALVGGALVVQWIATLHLSGWLGSFIPWQLAFLVAGMPGILVVLLMTSVREPDRQECSARHQPLLEADGTILDASPTISDVFKFISVRKKLFFFHFTGYGLIGTAVTAYLVWAPEMLRRAHNVSISTAGKDFGLLLLALGALGPITGGWLAQRFSSRGAADAEVAVSFAAMVVALPFVVLAPLVPDYSTALYALAPAVFLLSLPQGLAPAVLQAVSPNRMRGQVLSVFVLFGVVFAYTLGPTMVPATAKLVFGDSSALNYGLSLVSGFSVLFGSVALWLARRPFQDAVEAGGRPK